MPDNQLTTVESSYIPASIASVRKLFATLLRWEIESEPAETAADFEPTRDISGIIAFTGELNGTIVISFDSEVVFCAVEALLGDKPSELTDDAVDTVAELTNMVAGGIKEQLPFEEIKLGMPATVSGVGHNVKFDSGAIIERTQIITPAGSLSMQIAVRSGNSSR